jgi:tetratricopeptide (TPR) repeat protein
VTVYLYKDKIFGTAPSQAAGETEEDREDRLAKEKEEREERLRAASKRLERSIEKAQKLAAKGRWKDAEEVLRRGAKDLERLGSLDEKGELAARFTTAEAKLREGRKEFLTFSDALLEERFDDAGASYERLVKDDGPFLAPARKKLEPKKVSLIASADALCDAGQLKECLEFLEKAAKLDASDKKVAEKIGTAKGKLAAQKAEEEKKGADDGAEKKE